MPGQGWWHDGRTAVRHDVTLTLTGDALQGFAADGQCLFDWPLSGLDTTSATLDGPELLLGCRDRPGRLVIADRAFRALLLQRRPRIRPGRATARLLLMLIPACLLAVAAVVLGLRHAPPLLAPLLPQSFMTHLGDSAVRELADGAERCALPEGEAALAKLVTPLLQAAAEAGPVPPIDVEVIDLPEANGFAVPGRRIVLTVGLLRWASSVDEVAGVIAHEIGHVLEAHSEQALVRNLGLAGLAQVLGMGGDPTGGVLSGGGALLTVLAYSREDERAADAHAMRILGAADVPAAPLGAFLMRLDRHPVPAMAALVSTHPSSQQRLDALLAAPEVARPRILLDDAEWRALLRICYQRRPLEAPA